MPAKVVMTGFLLVIMASILVFVVEFFIPLSAKSDMNLLCRNVLLQMEYAGGISSEMIGSVKTGLENKGFRNVAITGTGHVRQGMELNLRVEADYSFSRLSSIFTRSAFTQHMIYNQTAMSRKVTN